MEGGGLVHSVCEGLKLVGLPFGEKMGRGGQCGEEMCSTGF